jgi:hypothetical protein
MNRTDGIESSDEPFLQIIRTPVSKRKSAKSETSERSFGSIDVLQASVNRRICGRQFGLTSTDRPEGVADQSLGKITTRIMASALGQKYAHSPFKYIDHADAKQLEYCRKWEEVLQIGKDCENAQQYPLTFREKVENNMLHFVQSHNFQEGLLYNFRDCHEFTEQYRNELCDEWKEVITSLRSGYSEQRKPKQITTLTTLTSVAVHINRDIAANEMHLMDDEYFLNIMRSIEQECPQKNFFFNIISEGVSEDFKAFSDAFPNRIHLYILDPKKKTGSGESALSRTGFVAGRNLPRNQHLLQRRRPNIVIEKRPRKDSPTNYEAFDLLVNSDLLILSQSSFSYLAALYSDGVKLHHPNMVLSIPKYCEDWDQWFTFEKSHLFFQCVKNK